MRKPLVFAVITLLGSSAFAAGEVYRWKDAKGVWNYSDQPHPGAELIRRSSAPAGSTQTPPPAAAQAAAPALPPPTTSEPLPVSKEIAQEVRQEAATAKAKRCEKAKADYQGLIEASRIKTKDDKGNEVFLDSAGVDKARLDARAIRDLVCAP
jgi:hypothetical protein